MLDAIFFYTFAALTLGGGVLCITRRNAVHSAMWLVVSLLGVGGLYLLQRAEFLFAVQAVVYIGGIVVLFLFVIMLVNLDEAARQRQFNRQWLIGLGAVALVGAEVFYFLKAGADTLKLPPPAGSVSTDGNTERLADVLFSEYLLPFEVASLLLLVAIVGSVVMAKRRI
ncbi:MAG: NADH-quinone oxidoreductase subunit J [Acidimicrobiia bacterium]|nr:NADH-quinone oxidoreductase subunit J [Acidimicrobiia bacterium]